MCGIIGLLIKPESKRDRLGEWVTPMMDCMGDRGPDSAGLAVFSPVGDGPLRRFSLFCSQPGFDWTELGKAFEQDTACEGNLSAIENHGRLVSPIAPQSLEKWLSREFPAVHLLSTGRSIEVYKDQGHPAEIAERYGFPGLAASHCVGHTRMATESAVSPAHAHPFTAGEDFCLVHNGSLSNPWSLRRRLEKRGIDFETDNDTEAACRFLEWRMRDGESLEDALKEAFIQLDGFYTLLMATAEKLVLVRDAFACKPAVVAETEDYVAVSSEFRSLAHLPDIRSAELFEPVPEEIYSWSL